MLREMRTNTPQFLLVAVLAAGCGPRTGTSSDSGSETTSADEGDTSGEEADGGADAGESEESESADEADEGVTEDFFVDVDGEPCDYWEQDCPTGFKCTTASIDGPLDQNVCRPVGGQQGMGEDCEALQGAFDGYDDCAKGFYCFYLDDDNQGTCMPQCTGTPNDPMCPDGWECSISGSSALALCLQNCDPLAEDCGEDQVCIPNNNGAFSCAIDQGDGQNGHGTACMFANQCNNGHACVNGALVPGCDAEGCCAQFCDLSQPDTCPDMGMGVMCSPWFEEGEAPEGFEDLGACVMQ